jgi:hypothetical protein
MKHSPGPFSNTRTKIKTKSDYLKVARLTVASTELNIKELTAQRQHGGVIWIRLGHWRDRAAFTYRDIELSDNAKRIRYSGTLPCLQEKKTARSHIEKDLSINIHNLDNNKSHTQTKCVPYEVETEFLNVNYIKSCSES